MQRREFLTNSVLYGTMLGVKEISAKESSTSNCAPVLFPQLTGLTKSVSEFVVNTSYSDIPGEVVELGKKSILDGIGLALVGSRAENARILGTYFRALRFPQDGATVIGTPMKLPARFAAFANGIAIHVEDYDDTQLAVAKDRVYGLLTHPTAPVLPAAFGLAETNAQNGKDLMLAYHLGVEIECKIAEAISPRHYEDGFHSTGTCTTFGSAAACAKLLKLDVHRTALAFGIAASQSAGLRENFGTMTKSFHAGRASEAGVLAVDLASLGWTAADQILEAPRGFFRAAGGGYDPATIVNKLGNPWTFVSPGISIKLFPSGSLTHPAMTEIQRLIRTNQINPADVELVEVGTNHNMPNALIYHKPSNALQAKFSMEFCMAILLLEKRAGLPEFTDQVVNRPDVQQMIARVRFYVDPEAESAGFDKMTSIIKIHMRDGRVISGRADFGKGSPSDPMSYEEGAKKFRECAAFAGWPTTKADQIIDLVGKLEGVSDVRRLAALCLS